MTSTEHENMVHRVMDAILRHTCHHFQHELGIKMQAAPPTKGDIDELTLRDLTAIIGIGGPVSVLATFSFDAALSVHVLDVETAGLRVTEEERPQFLLDTIAETINVILGQSTVDLASTGSTVALSAPVVLEDGGKLRRPKGAFFTRVNHLTEYGMLDVNFITPKHLYGENFAA